MIIKNTPIEPRGQEGLLIKREDKACPPPGPPFAKVRGLFPVLKNLKDNGVRHVGYMDTSISMAGWGISYFANKLGMKAVLFFPKYKEGFRHNQQQHLRRWKRFGAEVIPLENPNRLQINIHVAKKLFLEKYPNGLMLPNGLTFPETVSSVETEAKASIESSEPASIVMCVGSGAMMAGVLRGSYRSRSRPSSIIGILVHKTLSPEKKLRRVMELGGFFPQGGLFSPTITDAADNVIILAGKYMYEEKPNIKAPFPCNPYYDLKAYEYLLDQYDNLKKPVLFWNIGA